MKTNNWIIESGVFFQIPGNIVLHVTPGPGVFELVQPGAPTDLRIGLNKLYDKFEFGGEKFYQTYPKNLVDRIKLVWESDEFRKDKRSLGIILNGLKGSGKTWAAKQIANEVGMPVLIIDNSFDGAILKFIRNLNFSCTILVDEAEKIFRLGDEDDVLLRIIDSAGSNLSRHLFILTTNTLEVNPNLIGRTGRIRYLVNFNNLPENIVREFIDDNLNKKYYHLKEAIINKINTLEFNSIDLLRCIIEEVNITGIVDGPEDEIMNIPMGKFSWDTLEIENVTWEIVDKIEAFYNKYNPKKLSLVNWLYDTSKIEDADGDETNMLFLERSLRINFYERGITSIYSGLWAEFEISCGIVLKEPNELGIFSYRDKYSGQERIGIITNKYSCSRLYNNLI